MLLVADHSTHFSSDSLGRLVQQCGYERTALSETWVPFEISVVARLSKKRSVDGSLPAMPSPGRFKVGFPGADYLGVVARHARRILPQAARFGIFGTSIAGTWLRTQLKGKVEFFVDEDESRVGRSHLGIPIVSPAQVLNNSTVYIPLPAPLAGKIARRLGGIKGVKWIVPPRGPFRG